MASTTTQPIATRVPNHLANQIRQEAQRRGLTVSDVVGECVRQGLGSDQEGTGAQRDDHLRTVDHGSPSATPAPAVHAVARRARAREQGPSALVDDCDEASEPEAGA